MSIILDGSAGITTPPVALLGSTSGSISLVAPAVAGSNTQTLVAATGTLAPLISGTAVASTSGTSIDFTSIPSWAKRITVMFNGVSTNGTSIFQIQIGSGSFSTSGYASQASVAATAPGVVTTGFILATGNAAANLFTGIFQIVLISANTYLSTGICNIDNAANPNYISNGKSPALAGALDRVRITTVNGTDTFDAGTINIMYE